MMSLLLSLAIQAACAQGVEPFDLQIGFNDEQPRAYRLASTSEGCMDWTRGKSSRFLDESVCRQALMQFEAAIAATERSISATPGVARESWLVVQLQTRLGKQVRRMPVASTLPLRELSLRWLREQAPAAATPK